MAYRWQLSVCVAGAISAVGCAAQEDPDRQSEPNVPSETDPNQPGPADGEALESTLTATCATLQGRAIVSTNGDLGVSFTDGGDGYSLRGTIQWELPAGFSGGVPNPEHWDGSSERMIVAVTTASYSLYGNHCWFGGSAPPQPGTATISAYDPSSGVVRAAFSNYALHSCTGGDTCTLNGSIETSGQGVFE